MTTTVSDRPKEESQQAKQAKDPVQRFYDTMPKGHLADSELIRKDINGDGHMDAIIWTTTTEIQHQTTVQALPG